MRTMYGLLFLILIFLFFFVYPFHIAGYIGVAFKASLLSVYNVAAFITAIISYKQFIFPGHPDEDEPREYNHIAFHVFNVMFVILFFMIGVDFLLNYRQFYPGYGNLSDEACIKKYYLSNGFSSVFQIFIASSVVVNILYILTHLWDFYGRTTGLAKKKKANLGKG
jgi:hypothetical protein